MRKAICVLALSSLVCVALVAFAARPDRRRRRPTERRGALRECYSGEAMNRKYPEPIALITSVGADGKPNIITMGWTMFCGRDRVAIAVGNTRHSHKLISETKEFVYAFPGEDLAEEVLYCGTHSGRDVDKFKETGLTPQKAKSVRPPLIEECLANFECLVVGQIDAGSHTIFVGRIVAAWVSDEKKDLKRLFNLRGRKFVGLPGELPKEEEAPERK